MADGISLLEFTERITGSLHRDPNLSGVWITAELTDVGVKGGHCYMQLIEKNVVGMTVAKMRATIWSSTYVRLRNKFFQSTGRDIINGLKVMVRGSATHHSLYGLSFNIIDIDPNYTLGDLERLRREILEKLSREGVANQNKEIALPLAPQRIAVISSASAAGYGDFMDQLMNNSDGLVFYPVLFEAIMQGDRTASSVINALDRIEMAIDIFDCVVIIRGGGATTDMNGFDDYELAKRVCTYGIPVIVGIGHERDRNVLDELAAVRCKTPTAVAGFLIDSLREAWRITSSLVTSISREAAARIEGENIRLSNLQAAIPARVQIIMERETNRLAQCSRLLGSVASSAIGRCQDRLTDFETRLKTTLSQRMEREKEILASREKLLEVLSPANTLKRGYAIVRKEGKALKKISEIKSGDVVSLSVADGNADIKVELWQTKK